MKLSRKMKISVAGAASAVVLGAGGAAYALGGDDGEGTATGPEADKAREAALNVLPGGRVNAVELDNEAGATWEVEVTRADGKTVDVRLDANYQVLLVEGDGEDEGGGDK
jgi:hypothetical protein